MSNKSMLNFQNAITDYRFLLERGYPAKAALKLIGDRYRLSKLKRNCLFRGIVKTDTAHRRKSKIIKRGNFTISSLGVDWYNILITVESYLKGYPLFIADDGIVRDSAGVHGSYKKTAITEKAVEQIISQMEKLNPGKLDIFIDSPVSYSGLMAEYLRSRLNNSSLKNCSVTLVPSADYPLKRYGGIVASSDSIILDSAVSIIDLPRYVLKYSFNYTPQPIEKLNPPVQNG
ncbi:MAG: DUF434 domain-containing protein [Spirochaetales bacterium]|nr:DUF434 domain-containing protein [Spirochaetales bacterium]